MPPFPPDPANPLTSTDHEPSKTQLCPVAGRDSLAYRDSRSTTERLERPLRRQSRTHLRSGIVRDSLAAGGEEISVSAERMPRFCGGDINDFRRWLQAQVVMPPEMPDSCEQGPGVARVVVEKDGPPPQTEIVRSPSNALSREAMRVIDTSPAWETGPVGERPVRVRMYVSFRFRVEKPAPPSPQVPAAIIPDTVAESIPATHSASDVTMLTFRGGGMEKFREWFMDELEYSVGAYQRDLTGRSSIQFVVGKDDSLEASPCWKRRTKCSAKQ